MNFIICKLFINEPDFKKKEIKQQGGKWILGASNQRFLETLVI